MCFPILQAFSWPSLQTLSPTEIQLFHVEDSLSTSSRLNVHREEVDLRAIGWEGGKAVAHDPEELR